MSNPYPWAKACPEWLQTVSLAEYALLTVLVMHGRGDGFAIMSLPTLRAKTKLSRDCVRRCLARLESLGWIEKTDTGDRPIWHVHPPYTEGLEKATEGLEKATEGLEKATPILIKRDIKRDTNICSAKPRTNTVEVQPRDTTGADEIFEVVEENYQGSASSALHNKQGDSMKISGVRRVMSGEDRQVHPGTGTHATKTGQMLSLCKHLTQHTKKDHRHYLGDGQNAVWMRLLALFTYTQITDAIDELMVPATLVKVSQNGKYNLTAHTVSAYMTYYKKYEADQTDEEKALAERVRIMFDGT